MPDHCVLELDLGIAAVCVEANYQIEFALGASWEKWRHKAYPDRQSLSPSIWTSEFHFVDGLIELDRVPANSLSIVQILLARQNCRLYPGWETNPLLQVRGIANRIERVSCNERNSIQVSSNHVLLIDESRRSTCEFHNDYIKGIMRTDPLSALHPFAKCALPLLRSTITHASGVLTAVRKAVLFLAHSGGGKTTVTRLAQNHGYKVLGDDKVLVSQRNGSFLASSVPFNRITDGPDWGRIGALVMLKQGTPFSLLPVSPASVLPRTWVDNADQWSVLTPESRKSLFSLYCDLFSDVPVYEMTFERDFVDWAAIESVL